MDTPQKFRDLISGMLAHEIPVDSGTIVADLFMIEEWKRYRGQEILITVDSGEMYLLTITNYHGDDRGY